MEKLVTNFDSTLGAAFIGHFATTILYGITSLQTFLYYRKHSRDHVVMRIMVFVLWLLDSAHVALITAGMYYYLVTCFGKLALVVRPVWTIAAMIYVSNVSNSIVRAVFAYRVYKLSQGNWVIPAIIGVVSCITFGDGVYFATELMTVPTYFGIETFSWSLYFGFAFEVTVDIVVTASQCMLLHRYQTGIKSTDSTIFILMTYSINTGLLTSLCAIGCLISYAVATHAFVFFAFYFVLSKLYVNALLANLNTRDRVLGPRRRPNIQPTGTSSADTDTTAAASPPPGHGIEFTTIISQDFVSTHGGRTASKVDPYLNV